MNDLGRLEVALPSSGKGAAPSAVRRESGVTLIELMVSLVIGMLVLSGVTYVFFASRTTYGYNESLSRIQENARIALDALSYDMRMAGFFGCGKADLIPINVIANSPPVAKVDQTIAVSGYSYGDAGTSFVDAGSLKGVAGSDVLVVRRGAVTPASLVGQMSSTSDVLKLDCNPDGIKKDDFVLVTDCGSGELFKATAVDGSADSGSCDGKANTVTEVFHEAASNSSAALSKIYGSDAQVMRFEEIAYFLRDSGRKTKDGKAVISLFRRINGVDEEVAEGIEGMRLFFEINGGAGKSSNVGGVASTDWQNVVAVQVYLLMSTQEATLSESKSVLFPSSKLDSKSYGPDKVMRSEFVQTIALRNRLP